MSAKRAQRQSSLTRPIFIIMYRQNSARLTVCSELTMPRSRISLPQRDPEALTPVKKRSFLFYYFVVLGRFLAKVNLKTPLNGSGSKNGAEVT